MQETYLDILAERNYSYIFARIYIIVENNVPGAGYWAGTVFEQVFRDNLAAYTYGDINEVLNDPWDMTEALSNPPAWYTTDIDTLTGYTSFTDSISGMFEGTLSDPSGSDTMYLNTGTGSINWIDTDTYHNLTIAGKAVNTLSIILGWVDEDNSTHSYDIGEDITSTWTEIGPIDLDSISSSTWDDRDAKKIWLEFGGFSRSTRIRIGWITLTE